MTLDAPGPLPAYEPGAEQSSGGKGSRRAARAARAQRDARRRAFRPRLVRVPTRRPPSAALVGALWAGLVGLVAISAVAIAVWMLTPHGSATVDGSLRAAGLFFVATHLAPVTLADGATFSLLPLGLLALPLWLTYRSGRWAARASDVRRADAMLRLTAMAAVAYGLLVGAVAALGDLSGVHVAPWRGALHGSVVCAAGFGLGALRESRSWSGLRAMLPARWHDVVAGAVVAVLTLLVGAGVVLTAALAGAVPALRSTTGELASGVADGAALTLLGLLYLPTALGWAAAYVSGAGVLVGGAMVAPVGGGAPAALPVFPLLEVLPGASPRLGPLLLAVPILAGAAGALVLRRRRHRAGRGVRLPDLVVLAGLTCAAGVALAGAASGSLGDGRLATVGPVPVLVGIALLAEALVGAALAVGLAPVLTPVGRLARTATRRAPEAARPEPSGPGRWQRWRARLYSAGDAPTDS